MPPPMPVPTVIMIMSSWVAAAPKRNSPQAAALASFSITVGMWTRSSIRALSGSFSQSMLGAISTVDRPRSM